MQATTRTAFAAAFLLSGSLVLPAEARPIGPKTFCEIYPTAAPCTAGVVACSYCHVRSEAPVTWNSFGDALRVEIAPGAARPIDDATFAAALPAALELVAADDADADGTTNQDEIFAGTLPGDAASHPSEAVCPEDPSGLDYTVCRIDHRYLLRKVSIDFCGRSPTLGEIEAIAAADEATRDAMIDQKLDACLASERWRGKDGAVWRLAHRKIKPLASIKSGDGQGVIPLADYDVDYALFVYTQIDDHDARDVLLADYFVARTPGTADAPTTYARVDQIAGQLVIAPRRAGMLTSAWFLVSNVMFTALPRTAAAQAYRSYLGFDIARQEGLFPIGDEPIDYDAKGVTAETCAGCHATLDPLSYPFRNYNGLGPGGRGKYVPRRIERFFADEAPDITSIPEAGAILGEPVQDLTAWARVAADSDAFAAATVMDYWLLAFGAPPTPAQAEEFRALWQGLQRDGYSVSRMLRKLVHTEAYGAP